MPSQSFLVQEQNYKLALSKLTNFKQYKLDLPSYFRHPDQASVSVGIFIIRL